MSLPNESKQGPVGEAIDRAVKRTENEADPSEAKTHINNVSSGNDKGSSDEDKVKIIGGVVAVVAAVVLGVVIKKKTSNNKEHPESRGYRFGKKHGAKASEGADGFGSKISGAAQATKEKASEIIPQPVSDAASNIKDKANVTGIKAEKEGLKASEKSDHAVRDAADKLIHKSDKAGKKTDEKSDGLFSGLSNFFNKNKS